jgi:hypothetical protein
MGEFGNWGCKRLPHKRNAPGPHAPGGRGGRRSNRRTVGAWIARLQVPLGDHMSWTRFTMLRRIVSANLRIIRTLSNMFAIS